VFQEGYLLLLISDNAHLFAIGLQLQNFSGPTGAQIAAIGVAAKPHQEGHHQNMEVSRDIRSRFNERRKQPMKRISGILAVLPILFAISGSLWAQLPDPGIKIDGYRTALVLTDPQNDFLSPEGVTWGVVGKSVQDNNTVANIEALLKAAKAARMRVFISPHYYYPTDEGWRFGGAVEVMMHDIGMFSREGALTTEGFEGSGADWLAQYKPYIEDGKTIVTSPHKVYGPESNDLALQLRKRGIEKVVLAGMSANLCVESHLRALLEAGFEVAVVKDATAAAVVPGLDGYTAALTNFRFLASSVMTTEEFVARLK
jgi:nicotinamidase-related amidase